MAEARLWSSTAGAPAAPAFPSPASRLGGWLRQGIRVPRLLKSHALMRGSSQGLQIRGMATSSVPCFSLGISPLMSHPVVHLTKLFAVP